ncbi:MAG: TetR/AcrR family transcriptional regulator [Propionibacteriaceae bacterium]|nr:TetR/AcrR family transcriptional regulator [Propionibacteriaceae bacterium]
MPRITKPVEERRQEIIDTALALFVENGFDKTQVADISKRMGVAQGLVYHYFKSKTDILYAVIDQLRAEQSANMQRLLDTHAGTTLERLSLLFETRPDFEHYGQLIPSLQSNRAVIEYCVQIMSEASLPLLVSLIEAGNADGSLNCEYPLETALFVLHGLGGLVMTSDVAAHEETKRQAIKTVIIRALGADPAPPT